MKQFIESLGIALLTVLIYLFTVNTTTKPLGLYALLIALILLGLVYYFGARKAKEIPSSITNLLIYTGTAAILLWVGITGWYFSPFFWLLYLWGIALAFLYSLTTSLVFVLILMAVFIPNVGQVEKGFDILTLLSLATVIPLAAYLRQEYLRLRESEKKILILEKEKKKFESKVEELLANTVHNIAVELRESLDEVRELSHFAETLTTKEELEKTRQRILSASHRGLKSLREFEEKATGKKLLRTPPS